MAKVIVHDSGGAKREVPLDRRRMVIGRRQDVQIHIDDKTASGLHAAIITIGTACYLQDLKSTNGTLINGKAVQKHTLRHGDEIEIGRTRIRFVDEAPLEATVVEKRPPPEPPRAPPPEQLTPNLAGLIEAAPAAAPPPKPPAPPPATPRAPAAAAPAPPPARKAKRLEGEYAPWSSEDDEKDMVDSMISAIRSHREWVRTEQINRRESLDQEWRLLVDAAQKLKVKLAGHPQLKFFEIARGQDEILIRIQRPGAKGQHAVLLARQHPNVPSPMETIWMLETGEPDRHFYTCENVMRSVLRTLSPLIA